MKEVKEYTKSHHTANHSRDLLGKTQEGGCLCSGEKQPRTEQEAGLIWGFLVGRVFPGGDFQGGVLWDFKSSPRIGSVLRARNQYFS